ncbi:SPOR domain-containing protein [Azotobacter beijerinckii]|uniref:SPOR domain-containing protein n=1 Tax=Azotobacter beijerinckii TaxID=170623 RepID=UPI000AB4AEA9|nr:SPOR domain-containing protein [Azotobacter beijerinckii]
MAKNNAPKRGASRTPPPRKREIPSWLWMVCGLAVGGFAVFLTKLQPGSDAIKRGSAEPPPAKTAQAQPPSKPKYDFYTLLPESEVVVPPTAQQQPPQAQPPKPLQQLPALQTLQVQPSQPPQPLQPAKPAQQTAQAQPAKPPQQIQQTVPVQPTKPPQQIQQTAPAQPTKPPQQTAQAQPAKPPQPAQQVAPVQPAKPAQQAQQAQQTTQAQPPQPPKLTPTQDAARAEALLNGRTPPVVTAKPPALAKPAPTTQYYLQAGSFRSKSDAEDAKARIALLGQGVRVEVGNVRGETWHRVVAGPFSSRQQLEEAQKQLAGDGFSNVMPQQRQTH